MSEDQVDPASDQRADGGPRDVDGLRAGAVEVLRKVIDPEIGLNIVDLGLVYGVDIEGDHVHVRLTMTTPACPLGDSIVLDAEEHVRRVEGVGGVTVELVWEPPWNPDRMSDDAKGILGWGGP